MYRTEAEAWQAVAETLKYSGTLGSVYSNYPSGYQPLCAGLCALVHTMNKDGLITGNVCDKMFDRITDELARVHKCVFLFPAYEVAPRARLAQRFYEECCNG